MQCPKNEKNTKKVESVSGKGKVSVLISKRKRNYFLVLNTKNINIKFHLLLDMMPCRFVNIHLSFDRACCNHFKRLIYQRGLALEIYFFLRI